MKKLFALAISILLICSLQANTKIDNSEDNWTYGMMYQWRAHSAYSSMDELVVMHDKVYVLSNHSLFSVDKKTEEKKYYSRLTGLNSSVITMITYNPTLDQMLVCYQDGQLDIIDSNDDIYNIPDLYLKQTSISKVVNDVYMHGTRAYLAMNFGVICLDLEKKEVEDTYYIGYASSEVEVKAITVMGDSIYAMAPTKMFSASLTDNLMDYAYWRVQMLPSKTKEVHAMCSFQDKICMVYDDALWSLNNGKWEEHPSDFSLKGLRLTNNRLFGIINAQHGVVEVQEDFSIQMAIVYGEIRDIQIENDTYWLATLANGLVRKTAIDTQEFHPEGPINSTAYRMRFFGDRLYVVPGGRWATENKTFGQIMFYEDGVWTNIPFEYLVARSGHYIYDCMNVAQDPNDENHYFVTTYGTGLLEMRDTSFVQLYTPTNSSLEAAAAHNPDYYTRTDGAMFDEQGNLWVINAHKNVKNIHILTPAGKWHSYNLNSNGKRIILDTPGEILVDRRDPQWKWIPECRLETGIALLRDNGTPTNPSDDKVTYRQQWLDQNQRVVDPIAIYTMAQDYDNTIWVGTNSGIFLIPSTVDYTTSDQCERITIRRNDGTDLADYLLDNEQVNSIVVDGANRKWIGTATSGVYLLSADGTETIEHFTTENSLLPSDNVLSIAIQESTGEVFIGTSDGLVSYMSDAVEPAETFNDIYIYPNPVYPNYKGSVVIKELMSNTIVRIVDSNGNLVKILSSHGGEAVWDITNVSGERVASGIYTAICNTADGAAYGNAKVMVVN